MAKAHELKAMQEQQQLEMIARQQAALQLAEKQKNEAAGKLAQDQQQAIVARRRSLITFGYDVRAPQSDNDNRVGSAANFIHPRIANRMERISEENAKRSENATRETQENVRRDKQQNHGKGYSTDIPEEDPEDANDDGSSGFELAMFEGGIPMHAEAYLMQPLYARAVPRAWTSREIRQVARRAAHTANEIEYHGQHRQFKRQHPLHTAAKIIHNHTIGATSMAASVGIQLIQVYYTRYFEERLNAEGMLHGEHMHSREQANQSALAAVAVAAPGVMVRQAIDMVPYVTAMRAAQQGMWWKAAGLAVVDTGLVAIDFLTWGGATPAVLAAKAGMLAVEKGGMMALEMSAESMTAKTTDAAANTVINATVNARAVQESAAVLKWGAYSVQGWQLYQDGKTLWNDAEEFSKFLKTKDGEYAIQAFKEEILGNGLSGSTAKEYVSMKMAALGAPPEVERLVMKRLEKEPELRMASGKRDPETLSSLASGRGLSLSKLRTAEVVASPKPGGNVRSLHEEPLLAT